MDGVRDHLRGFSRTILSFLKDEHNFRQLDALPYAKDGTLEKKLDEVFGKSKKKGSK